VNPKQHRRSFSHVSKNRIHHRRKPRTRLPTALELKDAGVKVVIGSRDLAQGEQAVARLRAAGADADVLHFDITKPADHKAAYDYFNSRYGRLDILVNNAGIAAGAFPGNGPEHSVSGVAPDLLHKIFETNFFAQVALTRALLPLLKKKSGGPHRQSL